MSFEREELQEIRRRAEESADIEGLNPRWRRAYLQLSDAANLVDAIMARTIVQGGIEVEEK